VGIQRQETLIHWNFFLSIEEDLDRLGRFVDFSANDDAFSIEIARLFLAASAEVDVVLKQLCKALNPDSEASSINAYQAELLTALPNFQEFEVILPRYGLTLNPWTDWGRNHPPFWWQDHNKVKHHRHEHFDKANLKNCLNSIAALYVSVLHLYEQQASEGELLQLPRLFNVADRHFGGTKMGRYGHSFKYNLL
jgi:hypothetical protein